jgi:putative oxidoreductase
MSPLQSGSHSLVEITMSLFRPPTARQVNIGLSILRVVVGAIFVAHGAQKLFVYGFAGVTGAFSQMGVPLPGLVGPFIALLELFGGLALVFGLLTRLAALGLAFNMLGAILLVHLKGGFFLPSGVEFALSLLGGAALLSFTGAGAFSIDALIARRENRGVAEAANGRSPSPVEGRRAA